MARKKLRCYFGSHTWRMKGRPPVYFCVDCGKTSETEPSRGRAGETPVPPGSYQGPL